MVDASLDQKRTKRKSNYNHKNQTNLDDANGRLALHISIYEVLGAVDQAVQKDVSVIEESRGSSAHAEKQL
ncbi:MAG: hypothetical protein Q7J21_10395 [Rugosibacter sp.]|nr:hypothetical protein [Rugosibacter sp.]